MQPEFLKIRYLTPESYDGWFRILCQAGDLEKWKWSDPRLPDSKLRY